MEIAEIRPGVKLPERQGRVETMKTVLKSVIGLLVALVVVIAGGAYLIPPMASVERTALIQAPPDKVFAIVANLRRFNEWSPWSGLDPKAVYTFTGPEQGMGQKMSWASADPNVGNGAMTYLGVTANESIEVELDFGEMGKSLSVWRFSPADGGGTAVTWGFRSEVNGVMERWMSLMFDRWIGADYAKGLANLKALAEKEAAGG